MKFFNKPKFGLSQTVVVAVIFGFGAGIVGQIVSDVYINPESINNQLTNSSIDSIPELQSVKKFLGIQQDFEVKNALNKINPSIVGLYDRKNVLGLNQAYVESDFVSTASILTSDGWLISFSENLDPETTIALYNGELYDIEQIITDDTTGVSFVKILANNLPVVVLGDFSEVNSGQISLAVNALGNVAVSTVKNSSFVDMVQGSDLITSSEKYFKKLLISGLIDKTFVGAPIVNLAGEMTGVVAYIDAEKSQAIAVPISQFRAIILDVLRNNIVKRSFLGVNYVDLSYAYGLNSELTQGQKRGALVTASPLRNTPAAQAQILKDDIILSVDGQSVDKRNSLSELIQQYQPGDSITLEILRDGQNINTQTILAVQPE